MKRTILLAAAAAWVGMAGSAMAQFTYYTNETYYIVEGRTTNTLIDLKASVKLTGLAQGDIVLDADNNGTFKTEKFRVSDKDMLEIMGLDTKSKFHEVLSLETSSLTKVDNVTVTGDDTNAIVEFETAVSGRKLTGQIFAVPPKGGTPVDVSAKLIDLFGTEETLGFWEALINKAEWDADMIDELEAGFNGAIKGKTKEGNDDLTSNGVSEYSAELYAGDKWAVDAQGLPTGATTEAYKNRDEIEMVGATSGTISQKVKEGVAKVSINKKATKLTGHYNDWSQITILDPPNPPVTDDEVTARAYALDGSITSKGSEKDIDYTELSQLGSPLDD